MSSELYTHVSWCIWHEGVRLYDDSYPGEINPVWYVKQGCLWEESHNDDARKMIEAASDERIANVLKKIAQDWEKSPELRENFRWVVGHLGDLIKNAIKRGDFRAARQMYKDRQDHSEHADDQLAAVSNRTIAVMLSEIEPSWKPPEHMSPSGGSHVCSKCGGKGYQMCWVCGGKETIPACPRCDGNRLLMCTHCNGSGRV